MEREYVKNKLGGSDCYAYLIPSEEVEQVLKELLEEEDPSVFHWAIIRTQRNDNLENV